MRVCRRQLPKPSSDGNYFSKAVMRRQFSAHKRHESALREQKMPQPV
jgi:hypothetical protein